MTNHKSPSIIPGLAPWALPMRRAKFQQWWTRTCGLAFGYGFSGALEDSYTYLMEKFEENDRIFIFGFSRGAYIARALAAMVHMYGLMQKGNEPLIRYVLKMFTKKKRTDADFQLAAQFKATFSRQCKMHFVGVWDTVSSIGWLYDPLSLPYTRTNPDIEIGRHAVSIDERRAAFRQNLWAVDPEYPQDIQQVWFAGVHSDVGGGYPEPESGLAKITLQWMLEQAEAKGLSMDHMLRDQVLGLTDPNMAKPDCLATMHNSLTGCWWVLEIFPRRHFDTRLTPPAWKWELPLASPRYIAPGSVNPSNSRTTDSRKS